VVIRSLLDKSKGEAEANECQRIVKWARVEEGRPHVDRRSGDGGDERGASCEEDEAEEGWLPSPIHAPDGPAESAESTGTTARGRRVLESGEVCSATVEALKKQTERGTRACN
jgi:hypothetical protein